MLQAVSDILMSFPVLGFNVSTSLPVVTLCAAISSVIILQALESGHHLLMSGALHEIKLLWLKALVPGHSLICSKGK